MKVGDLVYLDPWLHDRCGSGLWIIMGSRHEGLGQEAYKVHCVTTGQAASVSLLQPAQSGHLNVLDKTSEPDRLLIPTREIP